MKRPGLTMPEMLIAIFVVAFIYTTIATIVVNSSRFTSEETERLVVGEQTGRLFSVLDPALRQAKAVLPSTTISGTTYTTDDDTLVFSMPAVLANGSLSTSDEDIGVVTLDTSQSGNPRVQILMSINANSTRKPNNEFLAQHVKSLYIRYNSSTLTSATSAAITLTIERSTSLRTYTETNILYATFRNDS